MYSPYSPYAIGMGYDEECAARDQHMWQPMSPPRSQANNASCVYCCGAHTYDICPSNPDSICFDVYHPVVQPPNYSWCDEEAYLGTSSVNSSYSCFQQPQQQEPKEEDHSSLKAMLLEAIENQSKLLRNLGNQVEEPVDEIKNQMPGYLPCDIDNHEVTGEEKSEAVIVESENVLEVFPTTSDHEGYVEESSTISIEDVLVSDKLEHNEHNLYEDPLELPMILDSGYEINEEEHLTSLEINSPEAEIVHYFEPLKVMHVEVNPTKASIKEPPDLELKLMSSHSQEVYSSSSLTFSIIISTELPPDKKFERVFSNFHDNMCPVDVQILLEDTAIGSVEKQRKLTSPTLSIIISVDLPPDKEELHLEVLQRHTGSGWMISDIQDIIYSLDIQIWCGNNVTGTLEERRRLKLVVNYVAPEKIIKWSYRDAVRNFTLRCKINKYKAHCHV